MDFNAGLVRTTFDPKSGDMERTYHGEDDYDHVVVQHIDADGNIKTDRLQFEQPFETDVPSGPAKDNPDGSKENPTRPMVVAATTSTYKADGSWSTDYELLNGVKVHVDRDASDNTVDAIFSH